MTGTVISFNRISVIRICDKRFFLFFYNFFILSDLISAPQVGFETEECMGVFFRVKRFAPSALQLHKLFYRSRFLLFLRTGCMP